ncbi:MAG: HNH endonuclease domain-containing protein [Pirellulaceae bacterium]
MIFHYPESRNKRRHGPAGYATYGKYRPWIRDEFYFRCVYCLRRERWSQVDHEYDLDHLQPRSLSPDQSLDYQNLYYACSRCNGVKRAQTIDDPMATLVGEKVDVLDDGSLLTADTATERMICVLDLNSPRMIAWRRMWIEVCKLAMSNEPELLQLLLGFPDDLPNLRKLRPPGGNARPEGIAECCFARRQNGDLPKLY